MPSEISAGIGKHVLSTLLTTWDQTLSKVYLIQNPLLAINSEQNYYWYIQNQFKNQIRKLILRKTSLIESKPKMFWFFPKSIIIVEIFQDEFCWCKKRNTCQDSRLDLTQVSNKSLLTRFRIHARQGKRTWDLHMTRYLFTRFWEVTWVNCEDYANYFDGCVDDEEDVGYLDVDDDHL